MKNLCKAAILCTLVTAFGFNAHAQERVAGSALEAQVTWTALTSKMDALQTSLDGVSSRLDQAILCGKANKLYAPGVTGADSHGCKDVDLSTNPTVNNLISSTTATNTYNGHEQVCTAQGYVYAPGKPGADANGCLKPTTGKGCTMDSAAACGRAGACVVRARYPFGKSESNTTVPTQWKDGEMYIWKYGTTQNDYGGAQCKDGTLTYFATGN